MTTKQGLRFVLVLPLLSSLGCAGIPHPNAVANRTETQKYPSTKTEVYADRSLAQLQRELLNYAD